ncbi:DUF1272 domain-containing protein [Gymnodinialimonas sp. 57CJ19]|uniref:DUF1272 domain-containing protein n=1 Tax=Gymnodinialimonas sp. 57CJ19 TaxID=3138498 RepID=UPI00313449B3
MLELRPHCEWRDVDLPPDSADTRICNYEFTYCARCVAAVLRNVSPPAAAVLCPGPSARNTPIATG